MKIPFEVKDISNPEELFGRNQLLKKLLADASMKQNINIIGPRRFGKTCVLKTMETLLKNRDEYHIYPVYIDLKTEDIKGTSNVYKYLVGKLISYLYTDKIFTVEETFGSTLIIPSDDWTEISEQLDSLSCSRIQALFQRIVKFFSMLMDKTILFMIDEYEYMFKYALDSPTGFMKLRTLSSDTNNDGSKPFSFWLTGSTPWDELVSNVPGSGEANTISDYEFITPISQDSFSEMWKYECSFVEDETIKVFLLDNELFAYEKSGGVPFYGKNIIGSYMYKNKGLPDYSVCNSFFKELTSKAISVGDYRILKDLSLSPRKLCKSILRDNLFHKGLISLNSKNLYYIPIAFLVDFIKADLNDSKGIASPIPETYSLVTSITDTIELINKQRINYNKPPVFKAVLDSSSQEDDLRTPCYTIEQLSDFTAALYNVFFERSKEGRGQLHKPFFHNNTFAKCVDIARHSIGKGHEMDNFEARNGQFSRADMYIEIMGSADELSSMQEFYRFQLEMLNRFKETLEQMFKYIKINNV